RGIRTAERDQARSLPGHAWPCGCLRRSGRRGGRRGLWERRSSESAQISLFRALSRDELVPLGLEGLHPLVHGAVAVVVLGMAPGAVREARHLEQAADLVVGEL